VSQVLCLDECTANIDIQTASTLQNVISSECQGTTVITIAHRISTVMNMDNILVLEKGSLVRSLPPSPPPRKRQWIKKNQYCFGVKEIKQFFHAAAALLS